MAVGQKFELRDLRFKVITISLLLSALATFDDLAKLTRLPLLSTTMNPFKIKS